MTARYRPEPFAAAVTGIGLVTAAGVGTAAAWRGVSEAADAPSVLHRPELHDLPCDFMYTITGLDTKALLGVAVQRLMDRFSQLAVIAAREAVADAGLDPSAWDSGRVAVVIGSAHGGLPFYDEQHTALTERGARRVSPKLAPLTVVNGAASSVATDLGAHGPSQAVSTACSSGTVAIGTAHQMLRTGACDIVVAGGAESVCSRLLIASACRLRRPSPPGATTPRPPVGPSTPTATASSSARAPASSSWNAPNTPPPAAPPSAPTSPTTEPPATRTPPSPPTPTGAASNGPCAPHSPTPD